MVHIEIEMSSFWWNFLQLPVQPVMIILSKMMTCPFECICCGGKCWWHMTVCLLNCSPLSSIPQPVYNGHPWPGSRVVPGCLYVWQAQPPPICSGHSLWWMVKAGHLARPYPMSSGPTSGLRWKKSPAMIRNRMSSLLTQVWLMEQ